MARTFVDFLIMTQISSCVTKSETMTVTTDSKGLRYSATAPDAQWAKDLIVTMKRGDIDQSSYGFICVDGLAYRPRRHCGANAY